MPDRGVEWKVGITVLAALVVLVGGVIFLGESLGGGRNLVVAVEFDHAGGIQEGDAVRVSGVRKGRVDRIELDDRKVRLTLALDDDTILYSDASFRVEPFGLMGEMMVAVDPGSGGDRLDPGRVQRGAFSAGLRGTIDEAAPMLEEVRRVVARIDKLLDEEKVVRPLAETAGNMRAASDELAGLLGESRGDIRGSLRSGRQSAERVSGLLARNEGNIDSSIVSIRGASSDLGDLVGQLRTSAATLEEILAGVEAGEGSLGKLAKQDTLHDEALKTLDNLNRLIDDIRDNPKRYLKIELF